MRRLFVWGALFAGLAAVAYFATLGCCHLFGSMNRPSLVSSLRMSAEQRKEVSALEQAYLARKDESCAKLCQKRAQLIELLKQPVPDRAVIEVLVREIGDEQASLEKATMDHLLAVREHLEPGQRERLTGLLVEQLRTACRMTACGATRGCSMVGRKEK